MMSNNSPIIFLRKVLLFASISLCNIPNSILAETMKDTEPKLIVSKLQKALVNSMKEAKNYNIKDRYEKLKPVIETLFHISTMTKVTTSSFWRNATENQKADLQKEFARFTAATYAAQFDKFSGETLKILGEKPGPQNTVLVSTEILRPGKKNVAIVYVIKKINEKLGIIDILLDIGISELARKRSEFRRTLSLTGLKGLTLSLREKTNSILIE